MSQRLKKFIGRGSLPNISPKNEPKTTSRESPDASPTETKPSHSPPNISLVESDTSVEPGVDFQVAWPPEVQRSTPLGAIRDASGNWYPRDIGRSSLLGGAVLYQFGDTFCHDQAGKYVGLASNTAALVFDKHNPTFSEYRGAEEGRIPDFIKLFIDEQFPSTKDIVYKIWSFSGTVEYKTENDYVYGWTWFQMREHSTQEPPGKDPKVAYIGIAKVEYHNNAAHRVVKVLRDEQRRALFMNNEPQLGDFCAVGHADYIYVYGRRSINSTDIVLGRVMKHEADQKNRYQLWSGRTWESLAVWQDLAVKSGDAMFTDMVHGQVFKTEMFGPGSRYEWAFIGCNKFMDSKVLIGRSEGPEGPWDVHELTSAYKIRPNPYPNRYCMYAHPWASDEKKGDICVSWSEGGLVGGVLGAILRLKREELTLEE